MKTIVEAVRDYKEEPIFIETDEILSEINCAEDEEGNYYPAQITDGGVIVIISMKKGVSKELTFSNDKSFDAISYNDDSEKKQLDIFYNNKLYTSYVYTDELKKPFIGPFYTKSGSTFTRSDLHNEEHPHQRSVFVGVGDVNGTDLWNEPDDSGFIKKGVAENIVCGSAFISFNAKNIWCDNGGNALIDENRKITLYNQSDFCRYMDIEITFTASYDDVVFGNTKEAGPLGIRVNPDITVKNGGYMKNSYGASGEEECWGKNSQWCIYGGTVDNNDCSIAVFDNESNERYPTNWHIRNYGLFAANNLYFRGALTIEKNNSLTYKYRICFFNNNGQDVSDRFLIYNLNK